MYTLLPNSSILLITRYIISNILTAPFVFISTSFNSLVCSTQYLRVGNILFTLGLYLVMRRILYKLHPYQSTHDHALSAFVLAIFPTGWFYNFLYYTDSGSTFFVLLAYMTALERKYGSSALVCKKIQDFNLFCKL